MGLISYKLGQTSIVLRVLIQDSSSTTGAGLTGLAYNSTGLNIGTIVDNSDTSTAYTVSGSTIETITTCGTYVAPTATKCRFKEVDATNHPGVYEIQLADARYAVSGAKSMIVSIIGATNAAPCHATIPLVRVDPYSANSSRFAGVFSRKYATSTGNSVGITIPVASGLSFATSSDWTPATGDVKVSKDGGSEANITSLPTYSNGRWFFSLSNTELTAKRIYVNVIATGVQSTSFVVETYGNASAQYIQDLAAANYSADVKAYDGVSQTPSAAGYPDVNLVALSGYAFDYAALAHILHRATRVLFVSTAGSDSNDGLSPSTAKALISGAISIATAGDVILVAAGTYDQGTTVVDVPDDVQIIGAGWQRTIVNSQVQNVTPNFRSIVEPGSRSLIKGITFYGNYTGDAAQRGIGVGSGSGAFTDAVVEDCRFFGNVDGLQLAKLGATNSGKFYRCRFESGFDAVAISYGTNTLEFYDCEFLADASWIPVGYTSAGVICRGIVCATSTTSKLNVFGGRYLATGGSGTNTGVQVSGSSSTVNVFGGAFDCSIYDLERSGGTLNAFDVAYDPAKISGTVGKYNIGIAQGYNSTLATNLGTTNTRVDVASSSLATAANQALILNLLQGGNRS